MQTIFITGAAGFIGAHLCKAILQQDTASEVEVIGIDNMNDYYDVKLKESRVRELMQYPGFVFEKCNIAEKTVMLNLFDKYRPKLVVNLAAQAGVRYSIDHPDAYIESNIVGFYNVLEACRYHEVEHLVYASSSSVYGANQKVPYATEDKVDHPVSLYAATKKSDELMAHAYSKLYDIPSTGLRFFTVYGPAGRPDMAYYKFTDKLIRGEKIQLYNYGDMYRDFTYIDDIVTGIINVMKKPPQPDEDGVRYKIYNIGNNKPEKLTHFVDVLEQCLLDEGIITEKAQRELLPMQPGDVYQTFADVDDLVRDFGFCPKTSLEEGLHQFAKWYKDYYGCEKKR